MSTKSSYSFDTSKVDRVHGRRCNTTVNDTISVAIRGDAKNRLAHHCF